MTEDTVPFSALLYLIIIFLLGLACLVHFFLHGRPIRAIRDGELQTPRWPLGFADFSLGFLVLVFAVISGQFLATGVIGFLHDPNDSAIQVAHGYLFHLSAILAVVALYALYPRYFSPFNGRNLPWANAFGLGFYTFLATVPVISVITFGWQQILEASGLPTDQQDVVDMFSKIETGAGLAAIIFLTVVIAPISEEVIFRGCLYRFLKSKVPLFAAIFFQATLFSLLHINWLSFIPLLLLGIILAYSYERTGSLKIPILLHAIFNANTVLLLILTNGVPG